MHHSAAALGLVSAMPSGPGVIADELVTRIAANVPPPVAMVLRTLRHDMAAIRKPHRGSAADDPHRG